MPAGLASSPPVQRMSKSADEFGAESQGSKQIDWQDARLKRVRNGELGDLLLARRA